MVRLDFGCGPTTKEGFQGVDRRDFGQTFVFDVNNPWPIEADSVDEGYSRNLIPCLTDLGGKFERVHFFNELGRVLKVGCTFQLIVPSWSAAGGLCNPNYQEDFKEGSLYFLNREWRAANAPDTVDLYSCDFEATWGYNMNPSLSVRNQEYQQFALSNYINSAMELVCTLRRKS